MSKLIIGGQEKIIHETKKKLLVPGTIPGQLNELGRANELLKAQRDMFKEATEAPTPNIGLMSTDILLRAVPLIQKTTAGGLVVLDYDNMNDDLFNGQGEMNFTINPVQELLVLGDAVHQVYPKLEVGMKVRFNERNFIAARTVGNNPEPQRFIDVPRHKIDGHTYLIMNASNILYYLK